jgi:hypothetical protein
VQALAAARRAGLKIPEESWIGIRSWIEGVTEENGRAGYTHKGTGKVFVPGMNESFNHHETMTAIGIVSRLLAEDKAEPDAIVGCDLLMQDLPKWETNSTRGFPAACRGDISAVKGGRESGPAERA